MSLEVRKTDARTTGRHLLRSACSKQSLISCRVVFNQSENYSVVSRALAINFGIPDAIYHYAAQQPGGPLSVFQDTYGFLNATQAIYVSVLICITQPSTSNPSVDSVSRRRCPG